MHGGIWEGESKNIPRVPFGADIQHAKFVFCVALATFLSHVAMDHSRILY